jgi:drug/metabolite transporter (DMT)-like permease
VIFGLGAALGWGLADLFAAVSGRRIGSWATVVIAQLSSALLIGLVFLLARPGDLGDLGNVAGVVIANAFLAAAAYATLYRALELGPIAVVSPLLASYAVIPVLLAVVLLGESLSPLQVTGVTVTIVGAILTSTDLAALRAGTHRMPKSLPWVVASTILFGVATYILGWAAREAGWLPTLWLSRTTTALLFALGAVVVRVRRGRAFERPVPRASLRLPLALGAVDVLGTMSYVRGAEFGLLSIVTAVSATYPLIPVFGGVRLFGERPSPNQYAGVAMVIAGLILLAIA